MKAIDLVVKAKWYDMEASGEKPRSTARLNHIG